MSGGIRYLSLIEISVCRSGDPQRASVEIRASSLSGKFTAGSRLRFAFSDAILSEPSRAETLREIVVHERSATESDKNLEV